MNILEEYLRQVNQRVRKLLVEGENVEDLKQDLSHPYGKNMFFLESDIPAGERCIYFLEFHFWQGHNGVEDISDLVLDFIAFSKADLVHSLAGQGKRVPIVGEHVRDDGFWEDGIPCFRYNHEKGVPMTICADAEAGTFELLHNSRFEPALHPEKFHVDFESDIFEPDPNGAAL